MAGRIEALLAETVDYCLTRGMKSPFYLKLVDSQHITCTVDLTVSDDRRAEIMTVAGLVSALLPPLRIGIVDRDGQTAGGIAELAEGDCLRLTMR